MYDDLRARGGNAIMWKTGHSLIKAKMKETHAELAGEMSGHMFFADRYYGFDDALYAACRLMEIVAQFRPAAFRTNWPTCRKTVTTPEIRFDCPDELKFAVVQRGQPSPARAPQDGGRGWRARAVPARLGAGAGVEHAAGAGDALRSDDAGVAAGVSRGNRSGSGSRQTSRGIGIGVERTAEMGYNVYRF